MNRGALLTTVLVTFDLIFKTNLLKDIFQNYSDDLLKDNKTMFKKFCYMLKVHQNLGFGSFTFYPADLDHLYTGSPENVIKLTTTLLIIGFRKLCHNFAKEQKAFL